MSDDSSKCDPFDVEELTPEQNKEIMTHKAGFYKVECMRVGPKGYLLTKQYANMSSSIYNFSVKSEDIFVVSFPKSGTTWTQELVWLLENNLDYEKAKSITLMERVQFLEASMLIPSKDSISTDEYVYMHLAKGMTPLTVEQIQQLPSPKFIKTHLPLSLLPATLLDTAKVVYVARDPRDVAVSFYYHKKMTKVTKSDAEFKSFWKPFVENEVLWTPYFDNLLEAWEKRNHPNLLFLFYEELSKDLPAAIRRVANFLGKELTDEQVAGLNEHLKFDNFKNNKSVNLTTLVNSGVILKDQPFIRKGKVGGWRDYFDEEMTEEAEKWIADNLRDTDFCFIN